MVVCFVKERVAKVADLDNLTTVPRELAQPTAPPSPLRSRWLREFDRVRAAVVMPLDKEEQDWIERITCEVQFTVALAAAEVGLAEAQAGGRGQGQSLAIALDQALDRLRDGLLNCREPWSVVVPSVETILAPVVQPVARTLTVHLVGHAHIDMNWLWDWPDTVRTARDTFRSMLQLMDEDPGFRFSQSQASVYVAMQELYPEIFQEIRRRVNRGKDTGGAAGESQGGAGAGHSSGEGEGQWEVTASTWVEADENMASGESLVHQLLLTKRYFARHFGLAPSDVPLVWQPDTFGHPFTMPIILNRAGIRYYYYCRGGHLGPTRWPLYWWEGPDGSRLLAFNDSRLWYLGPARPLDAALAALELARQTGVTHYLYVYGVGDHGGGPTRHDLAVWHRARTWPLFPRLQFSTVKAFFERVAEQLQPPPKPLLPGFPAPSLPVYRGELNSEFSGCYTSQARIKQQNRDGETYLTRAEVWRALAGSGSGDTDARLLEEAWQKHLFNQFHDILPGSGVPATYRYALGIGQQVIAAAEAVEDRAVQAVVRRKLAYFPPAVQETVARLKPEVAGPPLDLNWVRPAAVTNLLPWRRSETVTLSIWDPPAGAEHAVLIDPEGRPVLTQRLHRHEEWQHHVLRVTFPAFDLPPLGARAYAVLLLTPAEWEALVTRQNWGRRGAYQDWDPAIEASPPPGGPGVQAWIDNQGIAHLENELVAAAIEPGSGAVVSFVDKRSGRELVAPGARLGQLEVSLEVPHGMSAWKIGPFLTRQPLTNGASLRIERSGPVEATVVANQCYPGSAGSPDGGRGSGTGASMGMGMGHGAGMGAGRGHGGAWGDGTQFEMRITLKAASPRLEYHLSVDWLERGGPDRPSPTLQVAFPVNLSDAAVYSLEVAEAARGIESSESAKPANPAGPANSANCPLPEALYEIPFGAIRRPADGMEVPGQRFAAFGPLLLLNRGRYGFSATGNVLRMTLLRASYEPDPLPDQGRHEIEWAVEPLPTGEHLATPLAGAALAARRASEYQYPVQGFTPHAWQVPAIARQLATTAPAPATELSWLELCEISDNPQANPGQAPAQADSAPAPASVAWSLLKLREGVYAEPGRVATVAATPTAAATAAPAHVAQPGTGRARGSARFSPGDWIIRVYEVEGREARIRIKYGPALLAERGRPTAVWETDLLEETILASVTDARSDAHAVGNTGGPEVTCTADDGFVLSLRPYDIKTLCLHWGD